MSVDGIDTRVFLDDVTGAYILPIIGGHDLVSPFSYGGTTSEINRTNVSGVWRDVGGFYGITIDLINLSEGGQLTTRFVAEDIVLQIDVEL